MVKICVVTLGMLYSTNCKESFKYLKKALYFYLICIKAKDFNTKFDHGERLFLSIFNL